MQNKIQLSYVIWLVKYAVKTPTEQTVNESQKLGLSKTSKNESIQSQKKESMHFWDLSSLLGDKKT
jgi:hypothetical protein